MDDEFYKSLQLADPHTPDYVTRLKDEVPLVNLMQDTLAYYDSKLSALASAAASPEVEEEKSNTSRDGARVAGRIIEHVYYREQSLFNTAMQNAVKRKAVLLAAKEEA